MVAMALFRSRVFSGGIATMMLWAFGIFGIYFFTSLYLQDVLGFSPIMAGLAFVPMALRMALFAGAGGPIAARAGAHRTPAERSEIASAVLNASREVSGLLGITVIGAVLRSRQGIALQHGATPSGAFPDGYQAGLLVTVALVAAGALVSFVALRRMTGQATPATQAAQAPAVALPAPGWPGN